MTNTHDWYTEPHPNTYTDYPPDDTVFDELSLMPDTVSYTADNGYAEYNDNPEWANVEWSDAFDEDESNLYLPEDTILAPAQRPIYRAIMTLVAMLVIAGLMVYWLAPVLTHLLNPPPLPPLPPPWLA